MKVGSVWHESRCLLLAKVRVHRAHSANGQIETSEELSNYRSSARGSSHRDDLKEENSQTWLYILISFYEKSPETSWSQPDINLSVCIPNVNMYNLDLKMGELLLVVPKQRSECTIISLLLLIKQMSLNNNGQMFQRKLCNHRKAVFSAELN